MKQTALVVCPGRGTYNKSELGYLSRHHADKVDFIANLDALRREAEQVAISDLDGAERYTTRSHATSENASLLIYACALADFASISREHYDIVAVTGNSMGWYLALACGEALDRQGGAKVVNTMGTLMENQGVGGQIIYPLVDDDWRFDAVRQEKVRDVLQQAEHKGLNVFISIELGGMIVFAGDEDGLTFLKGALPATDRYPMELAGHAGFHSALLGHIPAEAKARLSLDLFHTPRTPLIDGRGRIWSPESTDLQDLYNYTFEHQIQQTYRFSKAIEVGLKEFAPDRILVLGPGTTMGAPVAQEMIRHQWFGVASKSDFTEMQKKAPVLLSMGLEDQRNLALSGAPTA
jgi:malonyl CoA-acyl carrier protein transacylase